jgi:hypothetical protein
MAAGQIGSGSSSFGYEDSFAPIVFFGFEYPNGSGFGAIWIIGYRGGNEKCCDG